MGCVSDNEHRCRENSTGNEVWYETDYGDGLVRHAVLVLLGSTATSHFEHSEHVNFCPYCGADLRLSARNNERGRAR